MVLACLLFSLMNASVYGIQRLDAGVPAPFISFVRVSCNMIVLLMPVMTGQPLSMLFGDRRPSLWLRGLFGSTALMLSFTSITRIGPGESAFLTATSGLFVALLSPWLLQQKNTWRVWLAIVGAFAGVSLMVGPANGHGDLPGRSMALLSGFLSALAYLMVAKAGRSNSPRCVIFYFCLVALMLHGAYFSVYGMTFPASAEIWYLLLVTGLFGTAAQFYMTRAYQLAPAALVSAVGYLAPVLSLVWGMLVFGQVPADAALIGSALILLFGVLLPFLR